MAIAVVLAVLLLLLGRARVRAATATAPEVLEPIKEDARWLAHESKPTSNGTSK